jgi:chromate transporter
MIYLELFWTFLQIGAFTFGGGYAMLPMMEEQVLLHGWMGKEELLNFIAVAESTPGPVAINMATYIGIETGGFLGAVCATFGVVLPSFIIIMLVAKFYEKYKNSFLVENALKGIRPVVIGLMLSAVISLGIGVFAPQGFAEFTLNYSFVSSAIVFAIVVVLALKKVSPILLIILSAFLGLIAGYSEKLFF